MKESKNQKEIIPKQTDINIDDIRFILQLHDGRIVSCTVNKTIEITDIKSKDTIAVLRAHEKPVTMIIQLNNGCLASCGSDALIFIWEISKKTNQIIGCLVGHREKINSLIEIKDQILSCSNDKTMRLWDYKGLRCLRIIYARSEILSIEILKDNSLLSHTRNNIKIWNLSLFQCVTIVKINSKYAINQILQLKDGRILTLFRNLQLNSLELFIWDKNLRKMTLIRNTNLQINIKTMIQLFDGRLLGFNYLGDIVLINHETFECIKYLRNTEELVNLCQFEDHQLICASKIGISIWNI